jgi:hypothetical protein
MIFFGRDADDGDNRGYEGDFGKEVGRAADALRQRGLTRRAKHWQNYIMMHRGR